MNPVATLNNQADIFTRAIERRSEELTSEVAKFIVSLDLAPDDETRMNELAEKAQKGRRLSVQLTAHHGSQR